MKNIFNMTRNMFEMELQNDKIIKTFILQIIDTNLTENLCEVRLRTIFN